MAIHFGNILRNVPLQAVKSKALQSHPIQPQTHKPGSSLDSDIVSLRFGNATPPTPPYKRGLEGVIADKTAISDVDPATVTLIYRGYNISDLVQKSNFEETSYLLLNGKLPTQDELKRFQDTLISERKLSNSLLSSIRFFPKQAHPMDKLKAAVSLLALEENSSRLNDNSHQANVEKATRLIAKLPTIIANIYWASQGLPAPAPNPGLSHAENFLYMLTGSKPDPYVAKVFDKTLIAYADHGFNASTTAARVTASTLSDMYSAIASAIGTLKGPLHGGANEQVMRMFLAIDGQSGGTDEEKIRAYVKAQLDGGNTVMGFGHREYKNGDPRAGILMPEAEEVGRRLKQEKWPEFAKTFKKVVDEELITRKGKTFPPNVDFPIGYIYHMLNLPMELYTPIFALARVTGWSSHVTELHDDNRLYRPKADYQGAKGLNYTDINQR